MIYFFQIFSYFLFFSLFCFSAGSITRASKIANTSNTLIYIINGAIIISFFAVCFHFFISLNKFINSIIFISLIIWLILNNKCRSFLFKKDFLITLFLLSLTCTILLYLAESNRPDAGLYHYPYVNYLNNEKIIFGLSNINSRFGHISSLQYLSAISNNIFFLTNGMLLSNALIPIAIYLYFFFEIFNAKKNNNDYYIFNLICLIFFTYKMNRYGEYGNDYYAHYYVFFLISLILKFKKFIKFETLLFYCSYIFTLKITFINLIILPILFFKKKIKILKIFFPFLIVLTWLIKNIIVSGCIIYPVEFTCFKKIDWTNNIINSEQNAKNVSEMTESWSKGWPDQKNNKLSYSEYKKNFNWLKVWSKNHGLKILQILLIFLLLIFFIFNLFEKKKINKKDKLSKKIHIKILFVCVLGIILWFVKYPVYRLGISNFIIFISIVYIYINNNSVIFTKKNKKIIKSISIFCLLIFIFKNSVKITKKYKYHYNNYPFPKYYSFDKNNYPKNPTPIYRENKIIYYKQNGLCMYSISPCTNENVSDKLYLTKTLSYKFLKFKNE